MNTEQKKEVIEQIDTILGLTTSLQFIVDDMQEVFDNKSDKWRESDKGDLMASRISL